MATINITVFSGHDAVKLGREVLQKYCNISMKAILSQNIIQMGLNFVRQANVICMKEFLDEFIHSVVCLTTGAKPLTQRALHIVRSRASSFK
jgi:hypothetical protein